MSRMSAEPSTGSNWNVPNALTALRLVMVPFYGWALLADGGDSEMWRAVAWAIFVVAMITDKVDGDIARKHDLITNFGKIADPIADKALTGMAFIGLSVIGEVWWWVTILVLLREWSVTLMRLSIAKHVVIAAKASGKLKTTLQAVALGALTLPLRLVDGTLEAPALAVWWVAQILLAGAVVITLWSGYEFFRDAVRQRREHKAAASA